MKLLKISINIFIGVLVLFFTYYFLHNICLTFNFVENNNSNYVYDIQEIIEDDSNIYVGCSFYNCILIYDKNGKLVKSVKTYTNGKNFSFTINANNAIEITRSFESKSRINKDFRIESRFPMIIAKKTNGVFQNFIDYSYYRTMLLGLNPLGVIFVLIILFIMINLKMVLKLSS